MKNTKLMKLVAGFMAATFSLSLLTTRVEAKNIENKNTKSEVKQTVNSKDLERKLIGYFPEWAYNSEAQGYFKVTDLQWDSLTHIQYSFAMVDQATNKIKLGDKHAALEEEFKNYNLSYKGKKVELDPNLPYKGHFNLLQTMKNNILMLICLYQ